MTKKAWFHIRVAMVVGFAIGLGFADWTSVASVLVTATLTALMFGLAVAVDEALSARKRNQRKNHPSVREPITHVKVK